MNLKTLQDIEFKNLIYTSDNPKALNGIKELRKEIKQEAAKWVRSIRKQCSLYKDCEICKQKVKWITHFFDLEEKEIRTSNVNGT